ncbi:MAG: lysostaphin resistance A-like protein [Halanaeroarchaeum sp.]
MNDLSPFDDGDSGGLTPVDPKDESPLYAVLGAVLVAVGGIAGAFLVTGAVVFALQAIGITLSTVPTFALTFLTGSIGFVGAATLYLRSRGRTPVDYVGIEWPSLADFGWVVGGYVAALALVMASGLVLTLFQVDPNTTNQAAKAGMENPVLLLWLVPLSFLVIAPGEEYLFRGTVQARLREAFPAWIAIPLTAAIFAVLHFFSLTGGAGGRFIAIGVLFMPSLVFGAIYEKTGNLVTSTLIHGAYNATLVLLLYISLTFTGARSIQAV